MPAFNALYYPSWNPPLDYLRSTLLFFDRVDVMVPRDYSPEFTDDVKRLQDEEGGLFGVQSDFEFEITKNPNGADYLTPALEHLAEQQSYDVPRILFDAKGVIAIENHGLLHRDKLTAHTKRLLTSFGLARPDLSEIVGRDEFLVIEERACSLIMSLLADEVARRHGLRTVTNESLDYALTYLNAHRIDRMAPTKDVLAAKIIKTVIPAAIAEMPHSEFLELRNRYSELRVPFQKAVHTLCEDARLFDVEEKHEVIDQLTVEFNAGVEKFTSSSLYERITGWIPWGIGSVGMVITEALSFHPYLSGAAGLGISFATQKVTDRFVTDKSDLGRSQQLINGLRSEVLKMGLFDSLFLNRSGSQV